MNKFAVLIATPGMLILADWAAHEHEAGYNTAVARALSLTFIFAAIAVFTKGQLDQVAKNKKQTEARSEAIRAMLQKSIDRNLNTGDNN